MKFQHNLFFFFLLVVKAEEMDPNDEADSGKPRFKDDADSKVSWEFPSKPKKLGGGSDVSKI